MTFTVFWHNFDTTEKNVLSKIQILKPLLQKTAIGILNRYEWSIVIWLYLNNKIEYGSGIEFIFLGRYICDEIEENSLQGLCTFDGYHFLMMMITQANCDMLSKISDKGVVDRCVRIREIAFNHFNGTGR